jgi:hypothetical protein
MRGRAPQPYRRRAIGKTEGRVETPRYVIERVFPNGWAIPVGARRRECCLAIVERNADEGVTWLHSYVREDGKKAFCVYDAPSPEAVRRTAARNGLPVDRITEVRVLDPYFYSNEELAKNALGPERRLER